MYDQTCTDFLNDFFTFSNFMPMAQATVVSAFGMGAGFLPMGHYRYFEENSRALWQSLQQNNTTPSCATNERLSDPQYGHVLRDA